MRSVTKRVLTSGAGLAATLVGTYGAYDMYQNVKVPDYPSCEVASSACEPSNLQRISESHSKDLGKNALLLLGSSILTGAGLATIAIVYIEQPLAENTIVNRTLAKI